MLVFCVGPVEFRDLQFNLLLFLSELPCFWFCSRIASLIFYVGAQTPPPSPSPPPPPPAPAPLLARTAPRRAWSCRNPSRFAPKLNRRATARSHPCRYLAALFCAILSAVFLLQNGSLPPQVALLCRFKLNLNLSWSLDICHVFVFVFETFFHFHFQSFPAHSHSHPRVAHVWWRRRRGRQEIRGGRESESGCKAAR